MSSVKAWLLTLSLALGACSAPEQTDAPDPDAAPPSAELQIPLQSAPDSKPSGGIPPTLPGEEYLQSEVPDGWIRINSNHNDMLGVSEYVPGDTTGEWQQKITYEALSSADVDMDPLKMLEGLANGQGPQCEHFVDNPIYAGEENGFPTVVRLFECHGNKQTGKPLVTMIKVIKGKTALYSVTRIWRLEAPAEGEPLPIDQSELAAWSNHLNKAILIRR